MPAVLEAKKICKTFYIGVNNKINVLSNIDLKIERGELVAVMGQSGSGKSTLLYSISGMDEMTSGEVYFSGKNIASLSEKEVSKMRLTGMGFIFQHSYLLKTLSIKDNIILSGIKAAKKSKKEVIADAEKYMRKLEISHIADNDITRVSGGQLQRAAICRALINEPSIIFADEPTGALNSSTTKEVMGILNSINSEGVAIMIVTHDAMVAARADRVIYLADGEICDQCVLGKYQQNGEDIRRREKHLSDWLKSKGF